MYVSVLIYICMCVLGRLRLKATDGVKHDDRSLTVCGWPHVVIFRVSKG